MDVWTVVWVGWIGLFVAFEAIALWRPQPGDTLSEKMWGWLKTGPDQVPTPLAWTLRAVVLGLLVWLIPHWLAPGLRL